MGAAILYFVFAHLAPGGSNWLRRLPGWSLPEASWLAVMLAAVWLPQMVELLFTVTRGWHTLAV